MTQDDERDAQAVFLHMARIAFRHPQNIEMASLIFDLVFEVTGIESDAVRNRIVDCARAAYTPGGWIQ